jgi:hypothetical protein
MSNDELMKKLQSLRDLRQAIDLMRNEELGKAAPVDVSAIRNEGQQAIAAAHNPGGAIQPMKHMGIRSDKAPGVVSHMIGMPGVQTPHHYEIDVNMNHIDSKIPAYTVHKVHAGSGQALESAPEAHKDISSAVKSLMSHAHTGKWNNE